MPDLPDLQLVTAATSPDASPYPGLTPFSTEQHSYFFGRDMESRILLSNMFASRLTVVHGPSGVGKSSLINAGLMPAVNAQDDVLAVVFRQWAGNPTKQLQRAIRKRVKAVGGAVADDRDLRDTGHAACDTTDRYLMLVLDQFEEFFLYPSSGTPFDQALGEVLADTSLPFRVLISMREDSLARLDRLEDHVPNPFDNVFRLEHLTRDGGRQAIVRPLDQHRHDTGSAVHIEDGLVDAVLEGVRAGRIMLSPGGGGVAERQLDGDRVEVAYLQLVMERLWTYETKRGSDVLRAATLGELGGVRRAVRSRFTELMDSLSLTEQDLAAKLFYFLVTPSKTKIAWSAGDLAHYAEAPPDQTQALLAKLAEPRYRVLRTVDSLGETGTDVVYEIFHDILARAVVEWQDRKARRSESQLRHLEDLREQLSAAESLVERGDGASRDALYPLLQTLAAELQSLDPVLADRARETAARLVEGENVTRSSRTASLIERKQVKLLQDEVQLLMRSGAASEELASLYSSRLRPFLASYDADVRRDAHLLEQQLLEWSASSGGPSALRLRSSTARADTSSLELPGASTAPVPPVPPVPLSVTAPAPGASRSTSFGGSDRLGNTDLDAAFRRPLWLRPDFYAFLVLAPLLNLIPLIAADRALNELLAPYEQMRDRPLVAGYVLLVVLWTALQLYAVIDNGLRRLGCVLAAFAPWVDGVEAKERVTGWPLHVLLPVATGALAMWLAALIDLPATFVFATVVAVATVVVAVTFIDAESLVWSPYRFRQAFRRAGPAARPPSA